ncbi:MAG: histidine phosphatase family protein [Xanthomonadales bacterium]|nr:histidine phosphatase family protein [Gammaproteobacteria bacterium]NNL94694.1 histidine phosphatase family protein [Xanthomonadales bacterium]
MSQFLYLLRHAKAEPWVPGVNDFTRPLSERGRVHMQALLARFGELIEWPEKALCSSSRRTRETLAPFVSAHPDLETNTTYSDAIYEATAGSLHALADEAFESCNSLMMVGHNPGFEHLALGLARNEDTTEIHKMPTGTLAVIEFPGGFRSDAGHGTLRHWIRRKDL